MLQFWAPCLQWTIFAHWSACLVAQSWNATQVWIFMINSNRKVPKCPTWAEAPTLRWNSHTGVKSRGTLKMHVKQKLVRMQKIFLSQMFAYGSDWTSELGLGIAHNYDEPVSNAKLAKCVFHNELVLKCCKIQESRHTFIFLQKV